jgi:hypothetical protein
MADETAPTLSMRQKIDRWTINEGNFFSYSTNNRGSEDVLTLGSSSLTSSFVTVFVLTHIMVYAFGFLNYSMKVPVNLVLLIAG